MAKATKKTAGFLPIDQRWSVVVDYNKSEGKSPQHLYTIYHICIHMTEAVSVRIDKADLQEIRRLAEVEHKSKSIVLREVLNEGLKGKKLELALETYRKREANAWKCARMAGVPLTQFMELLVQRGIDFHYGLQELRKDLEGLY